MSLANLTRYNVSAKQSSGLILAVESVDKNGKYIKSEEVEVMEASLNSLQQLRAKIADLINWYDVSADQGARAVNRAQLVAELRQLLAVQ